MQNSPLYDIMPLAMKKVLIIDSHPLFREYLRQKLTADQIDVVLTQGNRDYYTKMISAMPNLIVLDMADDNITEMEFLEKKAADPNSVDIPVIVTGPSAERSAIGGMARYGVIKYFAKPIQFDIFFEAIGNVLHHTLSLDTTQCVLDIHKNGDMIFIELAKGLNREKIALMKYKLSEMIEGAEIESPKIIIMLSNLELSFIDGYNLEFLIDNIMSCPHVKPKNVKILSFSSFVREFIDGHQKYKDTEVCSNLPRILNKLVETTATASVSDIITDRILTSSYMENSGSVETRFHSDAGGEEKSAVKDDGTVLNVAIIDANPSSLEESASVFTAAGAKCTGYTSGQTFMSGYSEGKFSLVLLDVMISDGTGFDILDFLRSEPGSPPVVVYSQSLQKDTIIRALSSGAKSYISKPQKPAVLLRKAINALG